MTAPLAGASGTAGWVVPRSWFLVPGDTRDVEAWAASIAAGDDARAAVIRNASVRCDLDKGQQRLLVMAHTWPWITATGWLRHWRTAPTSRELIMSSFERTVEQEAGLQAYEIFDVEYEPEGAGGCLMLHTVARAADTDELEERVTGFLLDVAFGVVRELSVVTRDVAAFDDLPTLCAEILHRSSTIGRDDDEGH